MWLLMGWSLCVIAAIKNWHWHELLLRVQCHKYSSSMKWPLCGGAAISIVIVKYSYWLSQHRSIGIFLRAQKYRTNLLLSLLPPSACHLARSYLGVEYHTNSHVDIVCGPIKVDSQLFLRGNSHSKTGHIKEWAEPQNWKRGALFFI